MTGDMAQLLQKIRALHQVNADIAARIETYRDGQLQRAQVVPLRTTIHTLPLSVQLEEYQENVSYFLTHWTPTMTEDDGFKTTNISGVDLPIFRESVQKYDDLVRFNNAFVQCAEQVVNTFRDDVAIIILQSLLLNLEVIQTHFGKIETIIITPNHEMEEMKKQIALINHAYETLHQISNAWKIETLNLDESTVHGGHMELSKNDDNDAFFGKWSKGQTHAHITAKNEFTTGVHHWNVNFHFFRTVPKFENASIEVGVTTNDTINDDDNNNDGDGKYTIRWSDEDVCIVKNDIAEEPIFKEILLYNYYNTVNLVLNCVTNQLTIITSAWPHSIVIDLPPNCKWRPYFGSEYADIVVS